MSPVLPVTMVRGASIEAAFPEHRMQRAIERKVCLAGSGPVVVKGYVLRLSSAGGPVPYMYLAACPTDAPDAFPELSQFVTGSAGSETIASRLVATPLVATIRVGIKYPPQMLRESLCFGTYVRIDVTEGVWSTGYTSEDKQLGCVGRVFLDCLGRDVCFSAWNNTDVCFKEGVVDPVPDLASDGVQLKPLRRATNEFPAYPPGAGPFLVIGYYQVVSARAPLRKGGAGVVNVQIKYGVRKPGDGVYVALWDSEASEEYSPILHTLTGVGSFEARAWRAAHNPWEKHLRIANVRRTKPADGTIKGRFAHNYESMEGTTVMI